MVSLTFIFSFDSPRPLYQTDTKQIELILGAREIGSVKSYIGVLRAGGRLTRHSLFFFLWRSHLTPRAMDCIENHHLQFEHIRYIKFPIRWLDVFVLPTFFAPRGFPIFTDRFSFFSPGFLCLSLTSTNGKARAPYVARVIKPNLETIKLF